jgi:hypothetical protein
VRGDSPDGHSEDQEGETDVESQGQSVTLAHCPAGQCARLVG